MFSDANEKIYMVYENQITSKQVYQILACFDKIYFKMTVAQRKRSRDGSKNTVLLMIVVLGIFCIYPIQNWGNSDDVKEVGGGNKCLEKSEKRKIKSV